MKRLLPPLAVAAALIGHDARAQTPFHLPWDVPAMQAGAHLEPAGFKRDRSGARGSSGDGAPLVYTREDRGVTESVYLRSRSGQAVQLFYSAVGDSAALQVKLDAVAADAAARLGAPAGERGGRAWQTGEGGRLVIPATPSRIDSRRFQFSVLFTRR